MKIEFEVSTGVLLGMVYFTDEKDIKAHKRGVYFELSCKELRLVATNGQCLGVFRVSMQLENEALPPDLIVTGIIPTSILRKLSVKGDVMTTVILDTDIPKSEKNAEQKRAPGDLRGCAFELLHVKQGTRFSGKLIDSVFPDYRHIFPEKVSLKSAPINVSHFPDLLKAYRLLTGRTSNRTPEIFIGHNGDDTALLSFGIKDFIGVLAPMRFSLDKILETTPEWVKRACGWAEPKKES